MRKRAGALSLIATGSVVLALGGPGALVWFKTAAAAVADVSVAFVVDLGGGNIKAACVKVPNTDNEYQALAAFTQQEQEAAPTYNDSGLLCSIAGVPTSGCGQADGRGYIYWSYWHGDSGTWAYSNAGASGIVHTCNAQGQDCDVEGWKFENPGAGNPTDPPPGTAPDYASICAATPPVTTTTGASSPTSTTPATIPSTPTTAPRNPTTTAPPGHPAPISVSTPSTEPVTGALSTTTPTVASAASSDDQSDQATSSGALASTGFGQGDASLAAIGVGLLLMGIGFFMLEDMSRRVRFVLARGDPLASRPRTNPVVTGFRTVQRIFAGGPHRFGRWILGRQE